MRSLKVLLIAALVLGMGAASYAELQNSTVSGSLRIRGNSFQMDTLGDTSFVEMRTRLGVQADFTDNVSTLIEFDNYSDWGEDFRSNWATGADFRGGDTVQLYQAYIQASEMWGTPLQLRIGRQEISLGSEWMMGVNDASSIFQGLSFDGVRATYAVDTFSVDAFWAKLAENFRDFGKNDTDLYGIYFSYLGMDNVVLDAYWMWVRENNDRPKFGFPAAPLGPAETLFGGAVNDNADLHTIGLRGAGTFGAFDYEAEAAVQFGGVDQPRSLVQRLLGINTDLNYSEWGTNLELGYTFDMNYTPRVFLGFAYLGGGDAGDTGGLFRRPGRNLAFNRMFSNWEYTEFFANTDESNLFIYRGGVSAAPTESLQLSLLATYFQVDNSLNSVGPVGKLFGWDNSSSDLGFELGLYGDYAYTSDLTFRAGWAHFFGGDGLGRKGNKLTGLGARAGNPVIFNGTGVLTADKGDSWDYLFIESEIKF